ncbi:hypothetical protein LTR56_027197 [Elasticomyces elasticus]|nr:hypothetical protein LTR56_027197 [Elasticomyces elasticus]KAK3615860.1 hypothetical protein LTR22_027272 [Elasticomyces elasticus]KAK4899042.1 hypothetical protein LTR49_027712 [Elasticomyces elasticus]
MSRDSQRVLIDEQTASRAGVSGAKRLASGLGDNISQGSNSPSKRSRSTISDRSIASSPSKSINAEKNKRKRGRAFTEQLRAEEGLGVLFFSPSKVIIARELAAAQESAKDDEALDRLLRAQDRAQLKADKELAARQKREDRAIRAVAKKTTEALNKA